MKNEDVKNGVIFDIGEVNSYSEFFIGESYLNMLTTDPIAIGNVTFEPGCRNNWHIHKAKENGGQILLVTGGEGYYQEEGKEAQKLKTGDVVVIPPNVKHWHGASKDSWFSHLAVEVPGIECENQWLEAVSDEEYNKLD